MPVIRISKQGYEALQKRQKETDVPITIIASKAIIAQLTKEKANPKLKESKSDPRLTEMKQIYFETWEKNNGFKPTIDGVQISHLKKIIAKLDLMTDVTKVTATFRVLMEHLPEWYKDKNLKVINSQLNEIIAAIKRDKTSKASNAEKYYGFGGGK